MDALFNSTLSIANELSVGSTIFTMLMSLVFGFLISFTYKNTQEESTYQKSLAITLLMLPVILSVIILFVGSNIARAFSLAGTLSIIRFRSAPGDAKDIGFIFFSVASGLACGVGLWGYGLLFVLILCFVLILLTKFDIYKPKANFKILKITIPEDLNHKEAFEEILDKYTLKHNLSRIKTTDLGSLFQVVYNISVGKDFDEKEFINELRCRNGNLTIMVSEKEDIIVK